MADEKLLRLLMRQRHTGPFEQCELVFLVRVPMDTWRQWIRHRTASVNEYSTRYTKAIDEMVSTDADAWRLQDQSNKQGSGVDCLTFEDGADLTDSEAEFHANARMVYEQRLERGVAREQARKDLPLSTITTAYWKIDLHNLLHFLTLRLDSHAQHEIRQFANVIYDTFLKPLFPQTTQAFQDYVLDAVTFTGPELASLRIGIDNTRAGLGISADMTNRECAELEAKLEKING